MEDFQFIFIVIFIGKVLETVNVVSKVFQSPKQESSTAVSLLNSALINLQEYKSQYSDFFRNSSRKSKKMGCMLYSVHVILDTSCNSCYSGTFIFKN